MINALAATAVIFIMLVLSELLWRKARIRGEFARKFIHIIAGTFIAFLPFWVSYKWVTLLAIGFIIANLLNRYTKFFQLFHAIHAITRTSWGDFLFGFGILFCSLLRPNKWLFMGAILQVSLADGFAALVGTHYGKRKYKVMDHMKTPIGTFTFFVCSLIITFCTIHFGQLSGDYSLYSGAVFLPVAITLTYIENVSGYGSDNLTLPLGFLLILRVIKL